MAVQYTAFLTLLFAASAFGIWEDSFTRISNQSVDECYARLPPALPNLDRDWLKSVKKWYVLSASAPGALRIGRMMMTGSQKDKCLLEAPCVVVVPRNDSERHLDIVSCSGVHATITHEVEDDYQNWSILDNNGQQVWTGKKRIVATDNKTFTLIFKCWSDGIAGFALYSTQPDVPQETWELVFKLVVENGFKPVQQLRTFFAPTCPGI